MPRVDDTRNKGLQCWEKVGVLVCVLRLVRSFHCLQQSRKAVVLLDSLASVETETQRLHRVIGGYTWLLARSSKARV